MNKNAYVSKAVIRRMPRYRRILDDLIRKKVRRISSNGLGELSGSTASQIRQDLCNFGEFGVPGSGYDPKELYQGISGILGLDRRYEMIIVGSGHLGQAIANYTKFLKSGFNIAAIFSSNPKLIGLRINDVEVLDYNRLDQFLAKNAVDVGIITTSKEKAQTAADKMIKGGVKGIWNFATAEVITPYEYPIENVHLEDSLHSLVYYIKRSAESGQN